MDYTKSRIFNKWSNFSKKYERKLRHKVFLTDCKHFDITLNCLKFKNWLANREEIKNLERTLLNKLIRRKYAFIESLKIRIKENREEMSRICNEQEMKVLEERIGFYRKRVKFT